MWYAVTRYPYKGYSAGSVFEVEWNPYKEEVQICHVDSKHEFHYGMTRAEAKAMFTKPTKSINSAREESFLIIEAGQL